MKRARLLLVLILTVTLLLVLLVYWGPLPPEMSSWDINWGKAVHNIDRVDRFYVRLDGNDTGWIDVGLNTTYTFYNVSKGDHTFHLLLEDVNGSRYTYSKNFTFNALEMVLDALRQDLRG